MNVNEIASVENKIENQFVHQTLEEYFQKFRNNIIGIEAKIETPYGIKPLIYTDWTASGRMYKTIEDKMMNDVYPMVANTHSETTFTGMLMTTAYHEALHIIKDHVGGSDEDVIICDGSGMTGVVNKFQRILGFKIHEAYKNKIVFSKEETPVVFVTHMEHHSNQTSWLETIADVVVVDPDENGLVSLENFKNEIEKFSDRKFKIAAITACSNVTGIKTPYYQIAELIHFYNGLCFVDFACSAPYTKVNMHPENQNQNLDAVYFSPHKFLGGPGTSGVLVFSKSLYKNQIPDHPGGGTVEWTNPWGGREYFDDIQAREDGGTPAFLQAFRTAMSIKLKDKMDVKKMKEREDELLEILFKELDKIPNLHVLANEHRNRQGIISFYIDNLHFNLGVKMLNDRWGIQARGGCSCAGTYGHYLLHFNQEESNEIITKYISGEWLKKPGWIRISIHPTTTNEEINIIIYAIKEIALNHEEWSSDYLTIKNTNSFYHKKDKNLFEDFSKNLFV
ncbi:MAG: aminotransferase class V-fold PLP-dependent enzyme [Chlorobiota bacterium]|nr:aminotransferase class V-fold PLP-dependent enzyme [Chlorobiota bacterium]QQS65592.1 MAG: aminotransferase class V-fold PLP-dependent enzyme [Chlorobiota bacterium]